MISYELAKELKEAGFPQPEGDFKGDYLLEGNTVQKLGGTGYAYVPTLSELIKACGVEFMLQTHDGKNWQAFNDTHTITTNPVCEGSTPEEAVAKLWLALKR